MLSVASVAMIEGSRKILTSPAFATPTAAPTARIAGLTVLKLLLVLLQRLQCPRADDRLDDALLAEVVGADLVDDPAARDHDDAVAEAGELERVARLDDHRDALAGLRAKRLVD